ncbi:MAG: bifunctional oligoribonuclease/PAP phosphatase NrnA [bacterium]
MTDTPAFPPPPAICGTIAERLKAGKRFVFSTHVYPDGDNLGSMTALMHALEGMGKECRAYVGTKVPDFYEFLPGVHRLVQHEVPSDRPDDYDACIIVDSGDINRMGQPFTDWMATGRLELINIDHHKSNTLFGDLIWVDPAYAAVGEQIVELLDTLGVPLNPTIGTCLMTSIMTDTGRFSFENTSLKTMTYATRLVEAGVSTHSVFLPVYMAKKLGGLRLQAIAMATLEVDSLRELATLYITQDMLSKTGAQLEESEGFIDLVNAIDEIGTVCFFKEARPGDFKLSIRTKRFYDAVPISQLFGGGGHARAAGATVPGHSIQDVLDRALPGIRAALDTQRAEHKG